MLNKLYAFLAATASYVFADHIGTNANAYINPP